MLERFITNLSTKVRREILEGKEYIVAPVVMLTEGVHQGNGGRLYYPAEELAKVPAVWNHKPSVVYHPAEGNIACTPEFISARKVGLIFNSKFDSKAGKLRAECWIDPVRAEQVDQRVIEALNEKKVMEVSTGLFTDNQMVKGEWNGEEYDGVARNYRPDHLALLPDMKGACSVADGAGLFVTNSMSHSNIHTALNMALRTRLGVKADDPWNGWVEDVYDSFFIYMADGKLYRLSYTEKDDGVEITANEPEPVKRVTEYRKAEDGSFVGNQQTDADIPNSENDDMKTKKDHVDALISNASTVWEEEHRTMLMGLSDDKVQQLADAATTTTTTTQAPATTAAPANQQVNNAAPIGMQTVAQYLAAAPPEIQAVLVANMGIIEREKQNCISVIVANSANTFTKEFLATKELPELQGLARIAQAGVPGGQFAQPQQAPPMFIGAAGAPVMNSAGVQQSPYGVLDEEPLPEMTLNFEDRKFAKQA